MNAAAASQRHGRGHETKIRRGNDDVLGGGAWQMLTQKAKVLTERLLASLAEVAAAIADAGVDHHTVARREVVHAAADTFDGAGAVRADDPAGTDGHPRKPAQHEEIEMIERDGVDAHAHVGGSTERRNRKIGNDLQLLQPAVGGDRERSHALVVPLY